MKTSRIKTAGRLLFSISFVWIGVMHFVDPAFFVAIVPPYLPWHLALVYISGACEIAGGLGVLFPATRRLAGWGILALLVAVYPANIHMLVNEVYVDGMPRSKALLWLRMPFQFVFAAWALWVADIWPSVKQKTAAED